MDVGKNTSEAKVSALVPVGVVTAALVAPVATSPAMSAVERELLLLSGADSLMNVPLNLFQVLANVPSTELGATTVLGNSLIYSGNWWSPRATNIWGRQPGAGPSGAQLDGCGNPRGLNWSYRPEDEPKTTMMCDLADVSPQPM
jgi:hypothetical protein